MTTQPLIDLASTYVRILCLEIPTRSTGSQGNREATDFFATRMSSCGFEIESTYFDCLDWIHEGADLSSTGEQFSINPSPYSPGCRFVATLRVISAANELAEASFTGDILLLRGEIAREPLMPKNFPFYNPEQHRQIISLLEAKRPQAILTASARNPEMAGALYPYPMIEDGDIDIPSAFMTEEEGERLAFLADREVQLEIKSTRIPASGCNVIARKGTSKDRRVVICAHIDAKNGTPGALDNAAGITTLLLLAELLQGYSGNLGIELVAMNGEDYYSNPGEQLYLRCNKGRFGEILLAINLDGVGYIQRGTAYSLYECPPELATDIRDVFSSMPGLLEGELWYQGDHILFLMNGCPALALTSEMIPDLMARYIHTSEDRPEIVDPAKLVLLAEALNSLIEKLDRNQS